jgi:hypothetical protein
MRQATFPVSQGRRRKPAPCEVGFFFPSGRFSALSASGVRLRARGRWIMHRCLRRMDCFADALRALDKRYVEQLKQRDSQEDTPLGGK